MVSNNLAEHIEDEMRMAALALLQELVKRDELRKRWQQRSVEIMRSAIRPKED